MEIPGGAEKSHQALWNGKSWGVGAQTGKNPPWGGYGYFLEPHIFVMSFEVKLKKWSCNPCFCDSK